MDKIWGYKEGYCAWCLDKKATTQYKGQEAGGAWVMYQVCNQHQKEMSAH